MRIWLGWVRLSGGSDNSDQHHKNDVALLDAVFAQYGQ